MSGSSSELNLKAPALPLPVLRLGHEAELAAHPRSLDLRPPRDDTVQSKQILLTAVKKFSQ